MRDQEGDPSPRTSNDSFGKMPVTNFPRSRSRQMSRRPTGKHPSTPRIGTFSEHRYILEAGYTSTKSHLPLTGGRESLAPLGGLLSTFGATTRRRGIFWSLTTACWMRRGRHTERRSFPSSHYAHLVAHRCRGRRRPEETQSVGSALRNSTELTSWVLAKGGVNDLSAGPGKWLIPTTYR